MGFRARVFLLAAACVGVGLVADVLIAIRFSRWLDGCGTCTTAGKVPGGRAPTAEGPAGLGALLAEAEGWVSEALMDEIDAARIEEHLRKLTEKPHLAGTEGSYSVAEYVRKAWLDQGLDSAHIAPYHVLLSYPDPDKPSFVALLDSDEKELFRSAPREPSLDLDPPADIAGVVSPFAGYSPSGTVQGDLVYVNYGRPEDFDHLEALGITVAGKIVIARYGHSKASRGRKLRRCQERGALGLIVYSDPADMMGTGPGAGGRPVYPEGWFGPGTAVQRGMYLYTNMEGEPLTPGYPAKDYMFRLHESESEPLPTIPAHPIGYDDAWHLLSAMTGPEAPSLWRGGLNITYRLGPGLQASGRARKVRLTVNVNRDVRPIHNVIGVIRGRLEPDRYVLLGNHHDAWNLGGVDPSSGTSALLEVSRAFGAMLKRGWRPRRSLVFCSWDAEEYGILGSFEWVEDFGKILTERAVAYLNVDMAVRATYTLRGRASPPLAPALLEAAKKVPWPVSAPEGKTMYDVWRKRTPEVVGDPDTKPKVDFPRAGSDYAPFVNRIGVPCIDLAFYQDKSTGIQSDYPLYHTAYATFHLQKKFVDPGFVFHRALAQLWAETARSLADGLVLPLRLAGYGAVLGGMLTDLRTSYGKQMAVRGISLDALTSAVNNFTAAAEAFDAEVTAAKITNPFVARMYNDQLMQLERAFIDPQGLTGRKFYRHTIMSGRLYSTATFPALGDAVYLAVNSKEGTEGAWRNVRKELSIITFTIQSAANTLTALELTS
ncbi:PREDICTED: N-acetylated-alpha-linked acidic dipeptidase 2-like [Branchiostoma belcheri]|uniref:Glutamate carboxypeptidase 2 n=1 Tax=Branchiostoma belcheri TaxID=7741 RepID=A0A6P5A3B9_BRABE|nr:PREDICTED: N-acetylated-alpha-linked acidic dipeptidase 2-like [Branchiostoma belcheri]